MSKQLMKGNEAVVLGAILGGSTHFFGYPITPASEIAHAAALYYPKCGREFLQAECEVASINMLYGASSAGARVLTASSGPGISLMAEGISYMAGAELPCVIVDVQRAGPGLGNIWPEQSDYNCVVKGGGHGNYKNIVLAPNSAQEMCDFTYKAFALAEKYRIVVFILSDAYIGQMMEPVSLPKQIQKNPRKDWAVYADAESRANVITSIHMNIDKQSGHNINLQKKYKTIEENEVEYEEYQVEDAEYIFIAYGICSRVCHTSVQHLRNQGIKIGLLRPKTLFPYPVKRLQQLAKQVKKMMVVEMSNGQMCEDVKLAVEHKIPVSLYNWMGGKVPSNEELIERVKGDL